MTGRFDACRQTAATIVPPEQSSPWRTPHGGSHDGSCGVQGVSVVWGMFRVGLGGFPDGREGRANRSGSWYHSHPRPRSVTAIGPVARSVGACPRGRACGREASPEGSERRDRSDACVAANSRRGGLRRRAAFVADSDIERLPMRPPLVAACGEHVRARVRSGLKELGDRCLRGLARGNRPSPGLF